ncbi:hypothetical protein NQ315_014839 [Exocentrus adspersus]|uniref:Transposase n=1 Tax=Exocentrus adspersus TaxID=1586481 RepID=A0AAV8VLK8_9CUCU|nr:hypothetical protein NQ315_014839 [Exocentrus adspersus]
MKEYMKNKAEGLRQFVVLDETWIFKDGTVGRSCQDSDKKSVKKTKVGGARYIHGEMNEANFLYWFEHRLLPNLAEPSTIVMDNASYHSTVVNKMPTTASKKADIQEWLTKNGIQFDDTLLKTQLLSIVRLNMPQPVYKADGLAEEHGSCVLRLPPYHCIFNPIEHIWGITKSYYRDHVGTGGTSTEKSIAMWKEAGFRESDT